MPAAVDSRDARHRASTIYLTALSPPGNIGRVVSDIQCRLLRDFALISSMAFPPVLPLVFSSREASREVLFSIAENSPGGFSTNRVFIKSGGLFLGINEHSEWSRLRAGVLEAVLPPASGAEKLFEEFPGFFLAAVENTNGPDPEDIRIPEPLRWRLSRLISMKIDVNSKIWWENISCGIIFDEKMKKCHEK